MRLGVDLGGTKIEAAVLDENHAVIWRQRVPTPKNDYAGALQAIRGLLDRATAECSLPAVLPVGIGAPGSRSPTTGLMRNCNSTALNDKPLLQDLQQVLQREVFLANDADCFALTEAVSGAGRDAATVFGIILGTGVGGGVVVNRHLLSGPNAIAGEWGHNAMPAGSVDGRPPRRCFCGRDNCVETWLSGVGLQKSFAQATGDTAFVAVPQYIERMRAGDARLQAVWRDYTQLLARALAVVINVIDPQVIVIGGGVGNIDEIYREVPAQWAPWIFSDVVGTRLLKAELGDSSGVIGAAWLTAPQG